MQIDGFASEPALGELRPSGRDGLKKNIRFRSENGIRRSDSGKWSAKAGQRRTPETLE